MKYKCDGKKLEITCKVITGKSKSFLGYYGSESCYDECYDEGNYTIKMNYDDLYMKIDLSDPEYEMVTKGEENNDYSFLETLLKNHEDEIEELAQDLYEKEESYYD